jgi:hypothetical protein
MGPSYLGAIRSKQAVLISNPDSAGRKMATDLSNGLYKSAIDRIFTTDKYVGFAEVVDRWQRQADVPFADVVSIGKPIVPQIEAWAKTQLITLEDGWKVDALGKRSAAP